MHRSRAEVCAAARDGTHASVYPIVQNRIYVYISFRAGQPFVCHANRETRKKLEMQTL